MKIVNVSIALMIFMNFGLNSYFYPELLMYQAGIPMSKLIQEKGISKDRIYIHEKNYSWTLGQFRHHARFGQRCFTR